MFNSEKLQKRIHSSTLNTQALHEIIENMSQAVVVCDTDGRYIVWNSAAQGLIPMPDSQQQTNGWTDEFFIYQLDKKTPFKVEEVPILSALKGVVSRGVKMFVTHKGQVDGKYLSVDAFPIPDEGGKPLGACAIFVDIEEEIKTQEALTYISERFQDLQRRLLENLKQSTPIFPQS